MNSSLCFAWNSVSFEVK